MNSFQKSVNYDVTMAQGLFFVSLRLDSEVNQERICHLAFNGSPFMFSSSGDGVFA